MHYILWPYFMGVVAITLKRSQQTRSRKCTDSVYDLTREKAIQSSQCILSSCSMSFLFVVGGGVFYPFN